MIPLSDSTPRRSFPGVNYLIILANILVFMVQLGAGDFEVFSAQYAFVPANFSFFDPFSYVPMITAVFMHGGFLHIISNMWFLHIFGDNVEDRIGHLSYLVFYLLAGIAATLAQYVVAPDSTIPMLGASGAISGVAGAYFVMHRKSTVKTLLPLFVIFTIVEVPAWLFLGYWFLIQFFSGVGSLVSFDVQQGGIAWFAHIGGFVFGYLYAKLQGSRYTISPA